MTIINTTDPGSADAAADEIVRSPSAADVLVTAGTASRNARSHVDRMVPLSALIRADASCFADVFTRLRHARFDAERHEQNQRGEVHRPDRSAEPILGEMIGSLTDIGPAAYLPGLPVVADVA